MRNSVLGKRIHQRTRNVILAGHVGKALRTIFPGQNLITHCETRSSAACPISAEPGSDCIVPG
jgi:hypothetical protein